jgi:hypothetical protein
MTTIIIHVPNGNFNMYKTAPFYNPQLIRALVLNGQNARDKGNKEGIHTMRTFLI